MDQSNDTTGQAIDYGDKEGKVDRAFDTNEQPIEYGYEEGQNDWTSSCICDQDTLPLDASGEESGYIMCDSCLHWQDLVCMGLPETDEQLPEHYFCHSCDAGAESLRDPGSPRGSPVSSEHEKTCAALEKGEKIWEERIKIWRAQDRLERDAEE